VKRKVDLLAVAPAEQLGWPCVQAMAEKEKITMDGGQCHQNNITLENK
jgi:hypothetical protein